MTTTRAPHKPRFVTAGDLRRRRDDGTPLRELFTSIGQTRLSDDYVEQTLGMPLHLRFVVEEALDAGEVPGDDALASLSFYSLCKGLFLPLSMLAPERTAALFGIEGSPPPDAAAREALLQTFLQKDLGLDVVQKLACVLGDPFRGKKSTFKRDSMLTLLASTRLVNRRSLIDRLTIVGDVAVLFSEHRPVGLQEPPLTSAEVLEALRFLPGAPRHKKLAVLRSLLVRMSNLEAYFLAKLLLRKAGFGFDYQGPLLARTLGAVYQADPDDVAHAVALTDYFAVARVLQREGAAGLKKIRLQPLVAIKPALASQGDGTIARYPVWVERKYDGIRLMLHKSTDPSGAMLTGAFTRTRGDWLELVAGLEMTIKRLPARDCIVDGELHGTVLSEDGPAPATVYDVYSHLMGQPVRPVSLRYTAFDLLYENGRDLTGLPLSQRRQRLQQLVTPMTLVPTPVPVALVDGQLAQTKDDVNKLFQYFRGQGYEGIIAKDLAGPYRLNARDASWVKRKPVLTLDLVLLGGVLAVTTKERAGMFGSYVIGARAVDGGFEDIGDVAGLDVERDRLIQQEIVREGLITGRRIERPSASGVRPGLELRPHIVVTVKFEGITRDNITKRLSLRDPTIVHIRSDKSAAEADTTSMLQELSVRERFS